MRERLELSSGWYVSISPADAALAASGQGWSPEDLELAGDPENHPRLIDLPGGPEYGLRPLSGEPAPAPSDAASSVQEITRIFVGPEAVSPEGRRLPHPYLSYAKRVAIPASWAGQRVFLHLYKARYAVTVQVNGQEVTRYVGGLEPHRVDITDAVTPGEPALVLITVGDSGVSGHRVFDACNYTGNRLPTCAEIENDLVHPVNYGGADRAVHEVSLEAVPPVRTEYVFARPRVSRGLLEYTVALVNDSPAPQTLRLRSEAVGAKLLVDTEVSLPAHGAQRVEVEVPWPDAVLWDLDNPHLYDLETTLTREGEILDLHRDYFGFREFTITGHSFYLNGRKLHLHGNSGHVGPAQDRMTLEEKIAFLRELKERGHLAHLRLHARPQDARWVEAADRVGMLLTTETALWTTNFHSFDWVGSEEACYENVRNHFMEALVRRDRNRPSVVVWSLSNEMSPITPWDLENPKMAAMTRVFERIIAEAQAEDDTRFIQMSSAMDFLGRLPFYNLHYPKSWQAFPDYPHTAYWIDEPFLFPWYGPARNRMPAWTWRRDKPLVIGEFTCVFGATPDSQACIVGDVAFEDSDRGTSRVNSKLWPMEIKAYRRADVSGFCAWSFALENEPDAARLLARPHVAAHTEAVRPLAVLDHGYRTRYFAGDEIALPLSVHNDTRHPQTLALLCEALHEDRVIWSEAMPPADFAPGENLAFTHRLRAPEVAGRIELILRAILTAGAEPADAWTRTVEVWPREADQPLPEDCLFLDPSGALVVACERRGLEGGRFSEDPRLPEDLTGCRAIWLDFGQLHLGDWRCLREGLEEFVREGGCVVLDRPPAEVLAGLPVALSLAEGFAPGGRLEITYAYSRAPQHPAVAPLTDEHFCLWGEDYYVARACVDTPQAGPVVPLLVAGTDRSGLTSSPLLELRHGRGSYLISMLELWPKLSEEPYAADLLRSLAAYRPGHPLPATAACVAPESLSRLREVGFSGDPAALGEALAADLALVDGSCLSSADLPQVRQALAAGRTVYLHALSAPQTQELLAALSLPGEVRAGSAEPGEYDLFRHEHPLATGMTHNYLYWIVGKSRLAPWVTAPLHPQPATALITLPSEAPAHQLTRRGAVTVYPVGPGLLVLDHLRWDDPELEEPERARRYLRCLLANLGVALSGEAVAQESVDHETAEERRERGHF